MLTAHAAPKAPIEWELCVGRATVTASRRRRPAVALVMDNGVALYLSFPDREAAAGWKDALELAAGRVFEDRYEMADKIGEGAFASVYSATSRETGQVFAVKQIEKKQFNMQMARELEREMFVMKNTNHEGIVGTYDVYNTQDKVLLVLDLMKGGTLKDNVTAGGGLIPEQHTVDIVRQVLHALHYLHDQGIVHRDIKLENILCETDTIPVSNIRLADFGYVNFVKDHADYSLRSLVGTPVYVAPEIISRHPYGAPVDMYAVGVMLYRMLSGSYPFDAGVDDQKTMELAVEGKLTFDEHAWAGTSIMCKNFVRALLQPRPERRLTAKAALHHPWIEGATTGDIVEEKFATSPVTPYSDSELPRAKRNTGEFHDGENGMLGKAHVFESLIAETEQITLQKMSNGSSELGGRTKSGMARERWKMAIAACMFLTKLRRACGFRPIRPPIRPDRLELKRSGRPPVVATSGSPPRLKKRMWSSGRRMPSRSLRESAVEQNYATGSTPRSLRERIMRTFSFNR